MQKIIFRQGLFLGLVASLAVVLLARLIDVQIVNGQQFIAEAENNRLFSLPTPANRGVLLDRYGQPLLLNSRSYAQKLQPNSLYSELRPLSEDEALLLLATAGATVEKQINRQYPLGSVLAHTLGYVGPVTAEDMAEDKSLLPFENIGKMGLEANFNADLRGRSGKQVWEINAQVSRQRVVSEIEPEDGKSVATTLDPYLSQVATQALGNQRGSVVISDAATGKILTLVSNPSFDPNVFAQVPTDANEKAARQQLIQSWFADTHKPFFNRAISGAYPPGSVFKLVTAIASLEAGAVDSGSTVVDEGVLRVGEYEYGNWYFRQYGRTEGEIGLVRSLARSNDIFFYKAAEWTGVNKLAEVASLFGFGKKTGIELSPEAEGIVPTPAWKESVIGEPWYLGNTYHMGIGQGDLLVTPVQVAQMTQAIGHNGQLCTPSIIAATQPNCRSLGLQETNVALVMNGMLDACSPGGTAFPFFPRNGEVRVAGATYQDDMGRGAIACKTGTAEFGGANEDGHRKTHGWWVGVVEPKVEVVSGRAVEVAESDEARVASSSAQVDVGGTLRQQWLAAHDKAPFPEKIVMVVLVESDEVQPYKEGSRDAGPVGKAILDWIEG